MICTELEFHSFNLVVSNGISFVERRVFRRMDDDGNRSLCYEEFRKGIEESGVKVCLFYLMFHIFFFIIYFNYLIYFQFI
jgi:hypothetical protein